MGIKRILHLSDVHIRAGDSTLSRYDEYHTQIDKLLAALSKYPYDTTMVVVTGDLFHDKSKMGPCAQLLAQQLFRGLSQVAVEVVVIRGNHDYRQDAPNEPDLIKPYFTDLPDNITYLDETGLFQRLNIEIGLVAVQDTLVKGAGSGINTNLIDFPTPSSDDPTVTHSIALFHGSFGGALLQNGSEADHRVNYPLDWIPSEYTLRLFGDIHVQQIHNAKAQPGSDFTCRTKQQTYIVSKFLLDDSKNPWGYAGSLIQQNFGESLWGHGFVEWNLDNKQVTLLHLPNDFGYVFAALNHDDEPCVRVRIGKSYQLIPVNTIVTYAWFPSTISLRISTKVRNSSQNIQSVFENHGIVVKDTGFIEETSFEESDITISTSESKDSLVEDLSSLNSTDTWIKFFTEDAKIEDGLWTKWVKHPHLLATPIEIFPQDIKTKLDKRNVEFAKQVDKYMTSRDTRSPVRHFRIHYIEFAWLLCFGSDNYLNFETYNKKVSLISGNNGSGKSSLLEIICLALFGESFPSRSNKNFTASVINQHKQQGESAYTRICVSIDGKRYWITRSFDGQPSNPKTLWQRTVRLIDESTTEIIKQTSSLVDAWVKEYIGDYEHFLMTVIVSQSNDSDFFAMKPQEQKAIIDSLLQLDVIEEFKNILKQSSMDHKFAITQLDTYEAGRKDVTKLIGSLTSIDVDAIEAKKVQITNTIQELESSKNTEKALYSDLPEKVFQTPLYDYENDKKQLLKTIQTKPDGDLQTIKSDRQTVRDRLAVLRTKRYKPTPGSTIVSFSILESKLESLKQDRLKRGGSAKLYDSKAHIDWLQQKSDWYKNHAIPQLSDHTLKQLETMYTNVKAEYDEVKDDIDRNEHKPVTDKVLKGLEKQHDTLTQQQAELEQTKKHLYKEIQILKAQITPAVKTSIQLYLTSLENLTTAFQATPEVAAARLSQLKELNQSITHLQQTAANLQTELAELIKIKFNKDCSACTENPYKHKRISLEQQQSALDKEIKENTNKVNTLLNSKTYTELKAVYDAWQTNSSPKILALIESNNRLELITAEHKSISAKIADISDDIEDVGFESQTNINDFYANESQLLHLENCIGHLKFSQQEVEYNLSKMLSELDQEISTAETHTSIAYTLELSTTESTLKTLDLQVEQLDSYNLALTKLQSVNSIIDAYPHYQNVQNISSQLKPLNHELATLEASLQQAQSTNKQMAEALTFEQQITTFRTLLEQRHVMISKLADAYNQYTSWLYPTKVGPAIEDAVNTVLNSIALPRPITLKSEWDKDKSQFNWFVLDGNSRPPFEKCSGSQRFFIGLAIRIALGRLGSSNMINDQLFLDEGFTACDSETMEKVPSLLNNLLKDSNKLNAVFMVSHLDQLKTAAAASIPIVRGSSSSRLTIGERQAPPRGIPLQIVDAVPVPAKKRGRPKKGEQSIVVNEDP